MRNYEKPLPAKELAELPDEAIDHSDIPEPNEAFWENSQLVMPETKEWITLRADKDIVEFFRRRGHGYQTCMNAILARLYGSASR